MAKIKYNVKGVERGGRDFEQPKPGLYEMEIKEATARLDDGKNDVELVLEVTKNNDEFSGSRVWTYVNFGEASQWKLAELTDALGLPETGTMDTDKLTGKKMKVRITADSWNGEYRARAGRFAPLTAEAEDDEDETEADDDETEAEDEFVLIERNDVELSTDPDYYDDWSDDDVFDEIDNQGISLGRKKKSRANVIAALIALVEAEAQAAEEEEEAEEEEGDDYDDTDTWSDKDIADEVKKRGLAVKGKRNRTTFVKALRADDAGGGDDDDPFAD